MWISLEIQMKAGPRFKLDAEKFSKASAPQMLPYANRRTRMNVVLAIIIIIIIF